MEKWVKFLDYEMGNVKSMQDGLDLLRKRNVSSTVEKALGSANKDVVRGITWALSETVIDSGRYFWTVPLMMKHSDSVVRKHGVESVALWSDNHTDELSPWTHDIFTMTLDESIIVRRTCVYAISYLKYHQLKSAWDYEEDSGVEYEIELHMLHRSQPTTFPHATKK
jgi:hypothetical protein